MIDDQDKVRMKDVLKEENVQNSELSIQQIVGVVSFTRGIIKPDADTKGIRGGEITKKYSNLKECFPRSKESVLFTLYRELVAVI